MALTKLTAQDLSSLARTLNLCNTPSNSTEWSVVLATLYAAYFEISQFSFGRSLAGFEADGLSVLVNKTLAASGVDQVIGACLQQYYGHPKCIDYDSGVDSANGYGRLVPLMT